MRASLNSILNCAVRRFRETPSSKTCLLAMPWKASVMISTTLMATGENSPRCEKIQAAMTGARARRPLATWALAWSSIGPYFTSFTVW